MALVYRIVARSMIDARGVLVAEERTEHESQHFSLLSALKKLEQVARTAGWRRLSLETVQVDIPGVGDDAGALDDTGPGFEKYMSHLRTKA